MKNYALTVLLYNTIFVITVFGAQEMPQEKTEGIKAEAQVDKESLNKALGLAIQRGDAEMAALLIQSNGVDVNSNKRDNSTMMEQVTLKMKNTSFDLYEMDQNWRNFTYRQTAESAEEFNRDKKKLEKTFQIAQLLTKARAEQTVYSRKDLLKAEEYLKFTKNLQEMLTAYKNEVAKQEKDECKSNLGAPGGL